MNIGLNDIYKQKFCGDVTAILKKMEQWGLYRDVTQGKKGVTDARLWRRRIQAVYSHCHSLEWGQQLGTSYHTTEYVPPYPLSTRPAIVFIGPATKHRRKGKSWYENTEYGGYYKSNGRIE